MEDSSRPGRERAREFVESISEKLGFLPDEIWASFTPEQRQGVTRAMQRKDSIIFKSVSKLAEGLYDSEARFLFELLQNADDNSFKKAEALNEDPFVAFRMYRDRIVVDCNEDGFTYRNLEAISAVGESSKLESSKSGPQRYIGEKGIGFKSVFMAAWKVTIQSGDFSFYFKHRRNDAGLGMIRPRWFEPEEKLPSNMTRMTLLLHEGDSKELGFERETIRKQLGDLQESLLLFTQNLKEIRVTLHDDQGEVESSSSFSTSTRDNNRRILVKHNNTNGHETTTSQIYHLIAREVYNLEKNENRTYSEEEEGTKAYAKSNVVLGFPLSEDSTPIETHQSVYAFLPVQEAGFRFLIQSDFVTLANRQGIKKTSQRNIGLLHAIADTFVQAVLEFCEHPTLRYTWMRFLPDAADSFDGFWSQLITLIKTKLQSGPVLESLERPSTFQLIGSLRRYSNDFLDEDGDLLFDDTRCISKAYQKADLDRLEAYELRYFTPDEILDIVEKDLGRGAESRLMSEEMGLEWFERSAILLLSITSRPESHLLRRLRSMPILPLKEDKYAAPDVGTVYFPVCAFTSLEIPNHLDLTVLAPGEPSGPYREKLFTSLGVISATVDIVRESIFKKHSGRPGGFAITSWVRQTCFLYLTHHLVQKPVKDDRIRLVDHNTYTSSLQRVDVYFPDEEEFGAYSLLSGENATSEGIDLRFLHPYYQSLSPPKPNGATKTWKEWLCNHVGVRQYVRLALNTPQKHDLSKELYFVSKHYPEKLLGFLRYNWREGGKEIADSSGLTKELQQLWVPCKGGLSRQLSDTYMPFSDLQEICLRFMREEEKFPFLELDEPVKRGSYLQNWAFLVNTLGVGVDADMPFYIQILASILEAVSEADHYIKDPERILDVYGAMYGIYAQSSDKESLKQQLRNIFRNEFRTFCPWGDDGSKSEWTKTWICVWGGPATFATKYPLRWQFANLLGLDEEQVDDSDTGRLFRQVLQVPDVGWKDILVELEHISELHEEVATSIETVRDLYSRLDDARMSLSDAEKNEIKSKFETHSLILNYEEDTAWSKVSQCLWSSATEFGGRVILSDDYEDLESFFVDFLGVETLNAQILFDELLNQTHSSTPDGLRRLKLQLKAFNSFIPDIGDYPNINPSAFIKKSTRIFPIRLPSHSEVELVALATDFAIADRVRLESFFSDQVEILDFDLDEVRELSPLFQWLEIESRYLSQSVKEISFIDETDARPVLPSENKVRLNAKALCRITHHFASPLLDRMSLTNLLDILQNSHIFETDGISSALHLSLSLGGEPYYHELERSDLHIRGSTSSLEIFVPRNKKRREMCYASIMPSKLFDWLMADPITHISGGTDIEKGRRLVGVILSSPRSVIPEILDREGIVSAGIEMGNEEDESDDNESLASQTLIPSVEGTNTPATDNDHSAHDVREIGVSPGHSFRPSEAPSSIERRQASMTATYGSAGRPRIAVSRIDVELDTTIYRQLLEKVVEAARRASFPNRPAGPLDDMADLNAALDMQAESSYAHVGEAVRFRSKSQLERDKMVGAAGELYMFELLKSLSPSLTMFSLVNWQSTIRDLVKFHPEYSQITRWPGHRETADLVYDDGSGDLTRVLIERGYLDGSWEGCTPNFLLEVKTTTGPCETPFFMSKTQYERMLNYRDSRQTVYIICRVFNLNSSRMGLRLYVDPAEMESTGELVFKAGAWSVVPGRRRN